MKDIERQKVVAEKLNGRLAMLGIIAARPCALMKISLLDIKRCLG